MGLLTCLFAFMNPSLSIGLLSCSFPSLAWQAKQEELVEEKRRRWLNEVDPGTKETTRATLLQCLLDGEEVVRHTAAQCIGAIASVDVPAGAWPALVEGVSPLSREMTLAARPLPNSKPSAFFSFPSIVTLFCVF